MSQSNYQITLRIPIDAHDDIEARKTANDFLQKFSVKMIDELSGSIDSISFKLQYMYDDKPPRKVQI
jgi:hypothetical protein